MLIKGIIAEDFINYKEPCMTIEFPFCDFKCDKECGRQVCHNSQLAKALNYDFSYKDILELYLKNDITKAICFQGLEPFDSWKECFTLINLFREYTRDPIVIYTGYTEEEVLDKILQLKRYKNIIIKFGRFVPDQPHHFDEVLGVELTSPNQYAKKII